MLVVQATGGMGAAEASLYGGLGGGIIGGVFALAGVLGGLFVERWLRSRGEVRCVIGGLRYTPLWVAGDAGTRPARQNPQDLPDSGANDWGDLRVDWTFVLRFFNEKGEPTGLHGVSVAFVGADGGTLMIGPLRDAERGRQLRLRSSQTPRPPPDLIDLPSQHWAVVGVEGHFVKEMAVRSLRWERIEVRAEHPDGKLFVREVADRRGQSAEQLRADYSPEFP